MRKVVCPLCVQWRCSECKSRDWPNCCDKGWDIEAEAYWPDGTIAILTQREYCQPCQNTMDEYFRNREQENY